MSQYPKVEGLPDTVNTALLFELQRCLKIIYRAEEMFVEQRNIQSRIAENDRMLHEYKSTLEEYRGYTKYVIAIIVCIVGWVIIDTAHLPVYYMISPLLYFIYILIRVPMKVNECEDGIKRCEEQLQIDEKNLKLCKDEYDNFAEIQRGEDLFRVLPPMYFHSPALEFMIDAVQKTLARDMHEAIVLYEQEEKRQEASAQMDDMIRAQRENANDVIDAINMNTFITYLTHR